MPVHFIRVVRELTDRAQGNRSQNNAFCKSMDQIYSGHWEPNADIIETEDHVIIQLEVAGVSRDSLTVKVTNGKLCIRGQRLSQHTGQIYFHQMEINRGEFVKHINLPSALEHNEISAHLQEGLLEIRISKTDESIEIPIAVEAKSEQ